MAKTQFTKQNLIDSLALRIGGTKADAKTYLEETFDLIKDAIKEGGDVAIPGFGKFYAETRGPRTAHNPRNPDQKIEVPAKNTMTFKIASPFKAELNA